MSGSSKVFLYVFLRLLFFAAAFTCLIFFGAPPPLAAVAAAVIALGLSYIFLRQPRRAVAESIDTVRSGRRKPTAQKSDEENEDNLLDHTSDETI